MKRLARFFRGLLCLPHNWVSDRGVIVPAGFHAYRCDKCESKTVVRV